MIGDDETVSRDQENSHVTYISGTAPDDSKSPEESWLTTGETGTIFVSDNSSEPNVMPDDPRLEQAFSLIRAVIADADRRAAQQVIDRIARNEGLQPQHDASAPPRRPSANRRAPHGSAEALIDRALGEAGGNGLTVLDITAKAESVFEKMVTTSAIRNWLRECERKSPPKYRQIGGVWYLASHVPNIKAVI